MVAGAVDGSLSSRPAVVPGPSCRAATTASSARVGATRTRSPRWAGATSTPRAVTTSATPSRPPGCPASTTVRAPRPRRRCRRYPASTHRTAASSRARVPTGSRTRASSRVPAPTASRTPGSSPAGRERLAGHGLLPPARCGQPQDTGSFPRPDFDAPRPGANSPQNGGQFVRSDVFGAPNSPANNPSNPANTGQFAVPQAYDAGSTGQFANPGFDNGSTGQHNLPNRQNPANTGQFERPQVNGNRNGADYGAQRPPAPQRPTRQEPEALPPATGPGDGRTPLYDTLETNWFHGQQAEQQQSQSSNGSAPAPQPQAPQAPATPPTSHGRYLAQLAERRSRSAGGARTATGRGRRHHLRPAAPGAQGEPRPGYGSAATAPNGSAGLPCA